MGLPGVLSFLTIFTISIFPVSNALQVVTTSSGLRPTGTLAFENIFKIIDSNKDGKISLQELHEAASFMWNNPEEFHRARTTFDLAHPGDIIKLYDTDGDGKLSKEELAGPMEEIQLHSSSKCDSLSDRLGKCKTSETIRCSAYVSAAEYMCHLDHPNIIETCILSSPCSSICDCVKQAEKAAHGESVLFLQYPDGHGHKYSPAHLTANSTFALGHPEKRILNFLIALLVGILAIGIASIQNSLTEATTAIQHEVGFMDFALWDSSSGNPPPSCSTYVFWSTSCGAIGSSSARGCSNGGSRVYGNSCKDHFRYGSRGCGFLGLGCRSICYAVNDNGCPCSIFDKWKQQDNIDYPGNDLESLHVDKLSDCRSACASSAACVAFFVPLADGTDDQTEAWGASRRVQAVLGGAGEFGLFDRREVSIPRNTLTPRINDDQIPGKAFPFDFTDQRFIVISQFLLALYRTRWINSEQVQRTSIEATLNVIGGASLTPAVGEPVADRSNPRWRVSEGWRVINVLRMLLSNAQLITSTTPVADYINAQPVSTRDDLNRAVMPQALRNLFIQNELIVNAGTLPWAGSDSRGTSYPGVQAVHGGGSNLGYHQGGAMGPMPLEGAFIMATQLAGINWRHIIQQDMRRPPYWLNAITTRGQGNPGIPVCLRQYLDGHDFDPQRGRLLGFMTRDGDANGGPREGFYVVIDVDGRRDEEDNPDRNVFVFAVHTIDPHSRINVPNINNLRNLQYTSFDPITNPNAAPAGPSNQAQQRFFAHAHAGYFPWNRIRDFMRQDINGPRVAFPGYTQIGSFHIYITSEDESNLHPRQGYLNEDNH